MYRGGPPGALLLKRGHLDLEQEVGAWEAARNGTALRSDWRSSTINARIKLKRLYRAVHA